MKSLRSASLILFACSMMSLLIAYERYVSTVETAERLAELMGMTVESVRVPTVTLVCAGLGVTFAVAGVLCYREYRKQKKSESLGL